MLKEEDALKTITEISKWIRDYADKNNIQSLIVGTSGGIDSAVVLSLCARSDIQTIPVYLPYISKFNARNVEKSLGMMSIDILRQINNLNDYFVHPPVYKIINDYVDIFCNRMGISEKVRKGNIMARVRMIVLYDLAKMFNGIVVGTTNRSEYLTGYYTKWGDGAADIEPIINFYKTEVYTLARKMPEISTTVLLKAPSAELWEGQTDEGELGCTYEVLDKILSHELPDNSNVTRMVSKSEHKRTIPQFKRSDI